MPVRHVVWDWNGTLLDDVPLLVEAANAALAAAGGEPITLAEYRATFTRPIQRFYELLLGRTIRPGEWQAIDDAFHDAYDRLVGSVSLAPDALAALAAAGERGSQSLLSMLRHDHLVPSVARMGIDHHFVRIDGLRGEGGGRKAPHLAAHLDALAEDVGAVTREEVLVVGDTVDDAHAAQEAGVACVLYAGGEHPAARLAEEGYPVATTLLEALELGGVGAGGGRRGRPSSRGGG
jgi:phosphoglycolate phosphatase-like HAD superfamily hydrolase